MGRLNVCTCIEGYLQLINEVIQIMFKKLWKKLKNLIKGLGRLVKLYTKHPPMGQNMMKFEHNGF
jgi:hypothetical protein